MKLIKLIAVVTALSSGVAMANSTVANTGKAVVDAGKTVVNTVKKPAAISLELGTLGYGANVAWSANETAEVVVGWAGSNVSADIDIGKDDSIINWDKVLGDEYKDFSGNLNLNANFNNPYVGVKVRPFANRLTVGTGVIFQDNELHAKLTSNNNSVKVTVNGKSYDIPTSGTVDIYAESGRSLAPYLTVGFKPNNDKRFGMFGEIGAVYTGDWKTRVDVSSDVPSHGELKSELEKEVQGNNLSWYPIVKLGATVRF